MNVFELLDKIYNKQKLDLSDIEYWHPIFLSKRLSLDKSNAKELNKCLKYLFKVKPDKYVYFLQSKIPKKYKAPFIKTDKNKKEKDELIDKIKEIFNWSDKEYVENKFIINQLLKNRKYWNKELGIKK